MTVEKTNYGIIKEGGKEYILVSQIPDYAKKHYNTSFGIPSYRTIRYYMSESIIDRPLKRGRETYFELQYILNVIDLLRELHKWSPTIGQMRALVLNARRHNEYDEMIARLESADNNWLIKTERRADLFSALATKRPSSVKISDIEKTLGKKKGTISW